MDHVVEYALEVEHETLAVTAVTGREAISEPYELRVTVTTGPGGSPPLPSALLGTPAHLTLRCGASRRTIHGMVATVEELDSSFAGQAGVRAQTAGTHGSDFELTLVPRLYALALRQDLRVFQGLSVPAIAARVVDAAGFGAEDLRTELANAYAEREYCVQYAESDLAFLSRLFEEEGIFYFFEHEADRERLVLADSAGPLRGLESPLPYRPAAGKVAHDVAVHRFSSRLEIAPGRVTLRDYDFTRPAVPREATAVLASPAEGALGAVYSYGTHMTPAADPSRLAQLRLEQSRVAATVCHGESSTVELAPGRPFVLVAHPNEVLNGRYFPTAVEHHAAQPSASGGGREAASYSNRFTCVPVALPVRPRIVTPRPIVHGIHTAVVVGPPGEEIHTDAHGRIKVCFHWDRRGARDDTSSCWVRVSQLWAGPSWGAMYLPRVGHEVIVDFVGGDPDRPVVVGSLYHGTNVTPYPLPAEKTKTTLKSSSTPGGDGSNELRFEDKRGQEEVYLHAQRDLRTEVENDERHGVGRDQTIAVARDRDDSVGHDHTEVVGHNKTIRVGERHDETIGGVMRLQVQGDRSARVEQADLETVGGGKTLVVGKDLDVTVQAELRSQVRGGRTSRIDKDSDERVGGTAQLSAGSDRTVDVARNAIERVGGRKTTLVAKEYVVECGKGTVRVKEDGKVEIEGTDVVVSGSGRIELRGERFDIQADGDVYVEAGGNVHVKGGSVSMN